MDHCSADDAKDSSYLKKRERNNIAVKKSREKSRLKQKDTLERVNRLRLENEDLEMKVKLLSKELSVLRDLFLEHAGINTGSVQNDSEEESPPVNALAAKMDHEYSTKPVQLQDIEDS